jgi:hypothetical protein
VLVLGGCYDATLLEEDRSGARLRRHLVVPEDGEPLRTGWYDTEIAQSCSFQRTDDGRFRCTPLSALTSFYEDDACTRPVLEAGEGCPPAPYVSVHTQASGCGEMPDFQTFFEVEPDAVLAPVYVQQGDRCVPDESMRQVHRTQRVDPTRFVAAEPLDPVDTGHDLLVGRALTEDGATMTWSLYDRTRDNAACTIQGSSDLDRLPCVPTQSVRVRAGGAPCGAEPWAEVEPGCAAPELAYELEFECGVATAVTVHAVGEPVPAAEVEAIECPGVFVGPVHRTRPADDSVPWLRRTFPGTGRLRRAVWTDDDGRALFASTPYYDAELELHCRPMFTVDGLRCLPDAGFSAVGRGLPTVSTRHFADPTCTSPVLSSDAGCAPLYAYDRAPLTCGDTSISAAYRVGAMLTQVYAHDSSGACGPVDDVSAYALEPLPLTHFARLELRVE